MAPKSNEDHRNSGYPRSNEGPKKQKPTSIDTSVDTLKQNLHYKQILTRLFSITFLFFYIFSRAVVHVVSGMIVGCLTLFIENRTWRSEKRYRFHTTQSFQHQRSPINHPEHGQRRTITPISRRNLA